MNNVERINGFDALRTIAMWLGVLLHSLIVYKAEAEPNWPHDTTNYYFLDWLYDYIHIFRMPLFYMVAGFFSRMVVIKKGNAYFINQRARRILLPFIIGLIIIVPISLLPFHFNRFYYIDGLDFSTSISRSLQQMVSWNGMAHLWFLYYLLFFYTLVVVYVSFLQRRIGPLNDQLSNWFRKISILHIAGLICVLFCLLYYYQVYTPPVYTGIKPNLLYVLYYGLFFCCGWLLQIHPKSIETTGSYAWGLFVAGTVCSVVRFFQPAIASPFNYLLVSFETIALVIGITGLFIKHLRNANAVWRYFSDASYWVYLVHVFAVSLLQVALLQSSVPGILRLPIVLMGTFLFTMVTYRYFVRFTIIGEYLHGKREK